MIPYMRSPNRELTEERMLRKRMLYQSMVRSVKINPTAPDLTLLEEFSKRMSNYIDQLVLNGK